ncbi:MAG: diguanylate cyclase [Luteimonas sp.]
MLNLQADAVRRELSQMRSDLATLHAQQDGQHSLGLVQANEKLLIAALHAHDVAETAQKSLANFMVANQRDPLTNTPNRALTLERLENAVSMAQRHNALMAVLFIDLDQLKSINDSMEHAAGDAVLQMAARCLESVVRSTDTVSRHGGDEFVVVLSELSQPSDASDIAATMLDRLAAPNHIGGHVIRLSASIGIAVFPTDGSTATTLIEGADRAMYSVKRRGGSGFIFHDSAQVSGSPPAVTMISSAAESGRDEPLAQMREANERLVMATFTAQELKELADEAHGKQIKFMAMVAHELRNPLVPIQLAAGMMSWPDSDEAKLKELQSIIEDEVKHLGSLVEDLLDGSRISTGKLRLKFSDVDIVGIVRRTIDNCMPRVLKRSQQIAANLPTTKVVMRGDKIRLTQIFSNLLDNASKYTRAGGHITVTLELSDENVVVIISDDGIGIPSNTLPHIFDLFVQEAGALSFHTGGLGVGLAVVRELVDAHGGTVSALSNGRDQGSAFTITLPLAERVCAVVEQPVLALAVARHRPVKTN